MKNSELLKADKSRLDPLDRQRQFILQRLVCKNPCPNCGHRLDYFEAAGIPIDAWDDTSREGAFCCSVCRRALEYVLPFIAFGSNGGWHWSLVPVTPSEGGAP